MTVNPSPQFDPASLRAEFPLLADNPRDGARHYLDNAATTQIPRSVLVALNTHEMTCRANVARGVYDLAEAATDAFETARHVMANYLGADDDAQVVFTSGTTAAINLVAGGMGTIWGAGDEVVISQAEHHSNFVPWMMLEERSGITVRVLPLTVTGAIDLTQLRDTVTSKTRLIAVNHASNVTGCITDLAPVVAAAKAVGAKVLVDGAQMAPRGPLDVNALGVDYYAFSGHKMYAPNGVGVLWGRTAALDALPPATGGGGMIRSVSMDGIAFAPPPARFEAGTPPIAQAIGLAAAVQWITQQDLNAIADHLTQLTHRAVTGLSALPGVRILGPNAGDSARAPVVSFDVAGIHTHDVAQILASYGVAVRGGHHCAQPLMEHFDVAGSTRASFAPYNDHNDVDQLLVGVEDAIAKLRK